MSYIKDLDDKVLIEEIKRYVASAEARYLPSISINTVVFSFDGDNLKVLLLQFGKTRHFMLPGGYVEKEEDIDEAAKRNLRSMTGLKEVFLEQFYTSGKTERNKDRRVQETLGGIAGVLPKNNWFDQRFVSVCFYALVDEKIVEVVPDLFSTDFKWVNVDELPSLLFDHNEILSKAIAKLQADLDQKLVAANLMEETFTMGELQKLYEAIYQRKFLRTNFQRKMLSLNILKRLAKQYSGGAHKAPYLYKFQKSK